MSRVFANGPGDRGSIPGRVIPKTQKMVLNATQHYKVNIKGKVEKSWEWSSASSPHFGVVVIETGAFGSPSTKVCNVLITPCTLICILCLMVATIFVVASHKHALNIKAVLAVTSSIAYLLLLYVYSFHSVLIPIYAYL